MKQSRCFARVGPTHEWHLDFGKAFRYFAFEFLAWFCQPSEMIATAFFRARFEAIGTVRPLGEWLWHVGGACTTPGDEQHRDSVETR